MSHWSYAEQNLAETTVSKIVTFRGLVDAVAVRRPLVLKWRRDVGRAVEERFGVTLPHDILTKVGSPLELANAVAMRLKSRVETQQVCQGQQGFYPA